jgi:hypothetical protein
MDNQNTIPSQLGPVNTIPAPLSSMIDRSVPSSAPDSGSGLGLKLALAAIGVALLAYLIR